MGMKRWEKLLELKESALGSYPKQKEERPLKSIREPRGKLRKLLVKLEGKP